MKAISIVIGLAIGLAVGFGGGYALWGAGGGSSADSAAVPDRQAMMDMTEEERAAFIEEQGMAPPGGMGGLGDRAGGRMGGGITGTVIAMDAESITVELEDGSSQTVYLGDETTYAEASDRASTALVEGTTVQVSGQPEADGVFTATSVVIGE